MQTDLMGTRVRVETEDGETYTGVVRGLYVDRFEAEGATTSTAIAIVEDDATHRLCTAHVDHCHTEPPRRPA